MTVMDVVCSHTCTEHATQPLLEHKCKLHSTSTGGGHVLVQ